MQQGVVLMNHDMLGVRASRPERLSHRRHHLRRDGAQREKPTDSTHATNPCFFGEARGRNPERSAETTFPASIAPTAVLHGFVARRNAAAPAPAARPS